MHAQALYEDQTKQIEQLTAQLQEVQMTKDRLETRCSLLEKVVSIRGDGGEAAGSSVSDQRNSHRTGVVSSNMQRSCIAHIDMCARLAAFFWTLSSQCFIRNRLQS